MAAYELVQQGYKGVMVLKGGYYEYAGSGRCAAPFRGVPAGLRPAGCVALARERAGRCIVGTCTGALCVWD